MIRTTKISFEAPNRSGITRAASTYGEDAMVRSSFIFAILAFVTTCTASAATTPCKYEYNNVKSAMKRVTTAENRYNREQNRLSSIEYSLDSRRTNYEIQISNAEANLDFARGASTGNTAGCVVNTFFGRGWGRCIGGSIASSINRIARAEARRDNAIQRLRVFDNYAAGAVYRQNQRVVVAQSQYYDTVESYNSTVAVYNQCMSQS
jgi:hypothetical protein